MATSLTHVSVAITSVQTLPLPSQADKYHIEFPLKPLQQLGVTLIFEIHFPTSVRLTLYIHTHTYVRKYCKFTENTRLWTPG